jgi:hypothetical protein
MNERLVILVPAIRQLVADAILAEEEGLNDPNVNQALNELQRQLDALLASSPEGQP